MKALILAIKMSDDYLLELNQAALDITKDPSMIDMVLFDYQNSEKNYDKLDVNSINLVNIVNLPTREVEGYKEIINGLQFSEYDVAILGNNIISRQVAISFSVEKKLPLISGITKITQTQPLIVEKDIYSNNLSGKFEINGKSVLIVASGMYKKLDNPSGSPIIHKTNVTSTSKTDWIISSSIKEKISENSLKKSKHVVVAGRGIGSNENYRNLVSFANQTKFDLGVTRPIYWNGWANKNRLVGASGVITTAKLMIVFGASGSSPFMIGIRNSEVVIAVNKDPRAPIFKQVDVGIVEDSNEIINELKKIIESEKDRRV